MTTAEIMDLIERYRTAGGREEHHAYFAERLMGWPLGWTSATAPSASSALETALWRCRLQQHLSCLLNGQD